VQSLSRAVVVVGGGRRRRWIRVHGRIRGPSHLPPPRDMSRIHPPVPGWGRRRWRRRRAGGRGLEASHRRVQRPWSRRDRGAGVRHAEGGGRPAGIRERDDRGRSDKEDGDRRRRRRRRRRGRRGRGRGRGVLLRQVQSPRTPPARPDRRRQGVLPRTRGRCVRA
jgi:hypothetical protein